MHEAPPRRFLRPIVAAVLAMAVVLGGGEWWRRNQRASEAEHASAVARAAAPKAPLAPVEPAPKAPSAEFRAWGRDARISGVLEREDGRLRALVNGRLVMDGDRVDAALELHLIGQDKAARRLIFEERGGARLEVDY
jgi:hypothetical protein